MFTQLFSHVRRLVAWIATLVAAIAFWSWLAVKFTVSFLGATAVGDDYNQFIAHLPRWAEWLFSTPWWVPAGLATVLTVFLITLAWSVSFGRSNRESGLPASMSTESKSTNVSAVSLSSSNEGLQLIVTPNCSGVTVGVFLDLSSYRVGGTFSGITTAAGWEKPQRFYLGDLQFRAPNLKVSLKVLEPGPPEMATLLQAKAWRWKTLSPTGAAASMYPVSITGKHRATFIFIDQTGNQESFFFFLVFGMGKEVRGIEILEGIPVVITKDDFP